MLKDRSWREWVCVLLDHNISHLDGCWHQSQTFILESLKASAEIPVELGGIVDPTGGKMDKALEFSNKEVCSQTFSMCRGQSTFQEIPHEDDKNL